MEELLTYEYIENFTKNLYFAKNPQIIFLIIGVYLLFVFYVGPRFMRNRTGFSLKKVLICYNILQVLWCAKIIVQCFPLSLYVDYTCKAGILQKHYEAMHYCAYQYFLMKILDLADTVFFVLRKKYNQITRLHVYHHIAMVIFSYYIVFFLPSPKWGMVGLVNSFVHFLMYGYYLLTVFIKDHERILWWKKHITQLQISQFVLLIVVYGQMYLFRENCEFSGLSYLIVFSQNFLMLFLFSNFYYNAYCKKSRKTT